MTTLVVMGVSGVGKTVVPTATCSGGGIPRSGSYTSSRHPR